MRGPLHEGPTFFLFVSPFPEEGMQKHQPPEIKERGRQGGRVEWKYLWRAPHNYFALPFLMVRGPDRTCMRVEYIINDGFWSILCSLFAGGWEDSRESDSLEKNINTKYSTLLTLKWRGGCTFPPRNADIPGTSKMVVGQERVHCFTWLMQYCCSCGLMNNPMAADELILTC